MTTYVAASWIAVLTQAVLIGLVFMRRRYLFVKPSIWVVVWFHLMVQWAAVLRVETIQSSIPEPWIFFVLVHGFPSITLVASCLVGINTSRELFARLSKARDVRLAELRRILVPTLLLVLAVSAVHALAVGVGRVGLVSIASTDLSPLSKAVAREESLKLVDSALIRYAYAFTTEALAPVAIIALGMQMAIRSQRRQWVRAGRGVLLIAGLLILVSLTGARGYSAELVAVLLMAYAFRHRLALKLWWIPVAFAAVFLLPTILSILRENQDLTWQNIGVYMAAVVARTFLTPMQIGRFYVEHAQHFGHFGISAIPKLASIAGQASVDARNVIGLTYVSSAVKSISANGSFVFTYYSYFGLWIFPFCLLATQLLDLVLVPMRRLSNAGLLMALSATAVSSVNFTAGDFTTNLVSHGFLPTIAFLVVAERIWLPRASRLRGRPGSTGDGQLETAAPSPAAGAFVPRPRLGASEGRR